MKQLIVILALGLTGITPRLHAEEQSSFSRGLGEGIGRVIAEKIIAGLAESAAAPAWTPGAKHPAAPHVVAAQTRNQWNPEAGYRWVTNTRTDLRVVWNPGSRHPADERLVAQATEGRWQPVAGFKWAQPDNPKDMSVTESYVVGIGTVLEMNKEHNRPQIIKVVGQSPAAYAALKPGLFITKIDAIPTEGRTLSACTDLIRGEPNSVVHLEVFDSIKGETRFVSMVRKQINL